MNAILISIGDELILGQTLDTNAAWLAQQLAAIGIECRRHVTIGDTLDPIRAAILDAAQSADLLLITGGLGPTPDDLTRDALAAALNVPLALHPPSLRAIEAFFAQRRRPMHEANRTQAMIPLGAEPLENTCGTAPGIAAQLGRARIYSMPGVPSEMKAMFDREVLPKLRTPGGPTILQHTLHTFGMSESQLGGKIADLMSRSRNPSVGTSAADLIISVRINARGASEAQAKRLLDADLAEIRARLANVIFGEGPETLPHAVAKLLLARHKTVSTAESCTGGLLAKMLTDIPGSSAYFLQGFITYSNDSKIRLLNVPADLINRHGAVSSEVAESMAAGCGKAAHSDYALAITGIAGPTGATPDKPIGLVYIALAGPNGATTKELRLGENLSRDQIRDRSAKAALNLLRITI